MKTKDKVCVTEHEILYNREVVPGYFIMGFKCEDMAGAKPGQFLSLSIKGMEKNMPVRRCFTIYKILGDCIEILYRIVGKGTILFSTLKKGEFINVLGPLGNTFEIFEGTTSVLIGRGCGLASLANLGKKLRESNCRVVTIGSFRNKGVNFIDDYIKEFSSELSCVYDDDNTSDVLNIRQIVARSKPDVVYCGGSNRIIKMVQSLDCKAYVSMEQKMGCGLGACVCCSIKTINGYKRVCKDGPCFSVDEITGI